MRPGGSGSAHTAHLGSAPQRATPARHPLESARHHDALHPLAAVGLPHLQRLLQPVGSDPPGVRSAHPWSATPAWARLGALGRAHLACPAAPGARAPDPPGRQRWHQRCGLHAPRCLPPCAHASAACLAACSAACLACGRAPGQDRSELVLRLHAAAGVNDRGALLAFCLTPGHPGPPRATSLTAARRCGWRVASSPSSPSASSWATWATWVTWGSCTHPHARDHRARQRPPYEHRPDRTHPPAPASAAPTDLPRPPAAFTSAAASWPRVTRPRSPPCLWREVALPYQLRSFSRIHVSLSELTFPYSPRAMKYHGLTGASDRSCITCLIWV